MLDSVKLDCIRIQIFLSNHFLGRIIPYLFKMIHPQITNRYDECFISLSLNSFGVFVHLFVKLVMHRIVF
jgi:hypothetical protein